MERRNARRRRGEAPVVESLEARQLLSAQLPPGHAAEVVAQSYRNARPAPQSPSPVTTRVTVTPDQPNYAPGQPIHLTLNQAVAGSTPVNTGALANYDVVVTQRGRELWRLSDDRGPIVASHVLVTMQPGESRQVTVSWNGRARDGSIVTGPVEIRAEIDRVSSSPQTVRIGGAPQASPTPISLGIPRPQANRHTPQLTGPNRPDLSADIAKARQLREQQARKAAEAAQARQRSFVPHHRHAGADARFAPGLRRPGRIG